jgi:hypothetical protein
MRGAACAGALVGPVCPDNRRLGAPRVYSSFLELVKRQISKLRFVGRSELQRSDQKAPRGIEIKFDENPVPFWNYWDISGIWRRAWTDKASGASWKLPAGRAWSPGRRAADPAGVRDFQPMRAQKGAKSFTFGRFSPPFALTPGVQRL